jgi:hypothetical protein
VAEQISSPVSKEKIFKISDGPIAGAAFMQDLRPTTTVARFVMQQSGHVLDLAIDSPGSVARAASNTTIPGVAKVTWEMQSDSSRSTAAGAALQYIDGTTVKTVLLTFPVASTTSTSSPQASMSPVRIQFLPPDIISLAASPDGKSLAYLLAAQGGSDGYIARADGSNSKKAFSLALSQVSLSWPSPQTLLAASKPAAGVPGVVFAASVGGSVSPILYAQGLVATADASLAKVVYQIAGGSRTTYVHDTKTNLDRPLSFDPMPEKCAWDPAQADILYCALPLAYVPPSYIDLWHQGLASAADSIVSYDLVSGQTTLLGTPGGTDGGVPTDVAELSVSADGKYLLFIKKGDRSLWGMRL